MVSRQVEIPRNQKAPVVPLSIHHASCSLALSLRSTHCTVASKLKETTVSADASVRLTVPVAVTLTPFVGDSVGSVSLKSVWATVVAEMGQSGILKLTSCFTTGIVVEQFAPQAAQSNFQLITRSTLRFVLFVSQPV